MIGAYYETHSVSPIGLGLDQSMVDVAMSTMQSLLSSLRPLVTVIPWATEDGAQWVPSVTPEVRYALYPVDAALLDRVQSAAFGQPVGFVAVLDTVMRAAPENLFDGTPWEYFQSQAVFSELDSGNPPAVRFLYWGKLRDDLGTKGSSATLEAKVAAAKASLVYPVTLPIEGAARGMPTAPFDQAIAVATKTAQASAIPVAPGSPKSSPSAPTSSPAPAASSSNWGAGLLLLSVAAVGGYVAYRVVRRR